MSLYLSPPAARWLQDHHGVASSAELRGLGVGRKVTESLCRAGILRRFSRGVFVLAGIAETLQHRCRLLSCLHPAGFVTGPTAGMLAGLRRMPSRTLLHYSVPHGLRLDSINGVRFRQTTSLRDDDRWRRRDGIVVASWRRLAFDLAADLSPLNHRSVIHQLLDNQRLDAEELIGIAQRLCHPARRGSTTFRLSLLELGQAPHDSHPEVVLADALLRRGVPVEPQVPVTRPDGITVHVDLAVPVVRWGVELDIHPEHRSVDGHHRGSGRSRSLHGVEWQIEPVAELDMGGLDELADELAGLYQARERSIGGLNGPTGVAQPSGGFQTSGD